MGILTKRAREIMHRHPIDAYERLSSIICLRLILAIPYCYHPKQDGTGCRRGLEGEQISLSARILAVVAFWDMLNSDRPDRKRWVEEQISGSCPQQPTNTST